MYWSILALHVKLLQTQLNNSCLALYNFYII